MMALRAHVYSCKSIFDLRSGLPSSSVAQATVEGKVLSVTANMIHIFATMSPSATYFEAPSADNLPEAALSPCVSRKKCGRSLYRTLPTKVLELNPD